MQNGAPFEIEVNDLIVRVTSHIINNDEVFRLVFSDGRPPLVVVETFIGSKLSRTDFWTSVPAGRQKEAQFFGEKIAAYFKNK